MHYQLDPIIYYKNTLLFSEKAKQEVHINFCYIYSRMLTSKLKKSDKATYFTENFNGRGHLLLTDPLVFLFFGCSLQYKHRLSRNITQLLIKWAK